MPIGKMILVAWSFPKINPENKFRYLYTKSIRTLNDTAIIKKNFLFFLSLLLSINIDKWLPDDDNSEWDDLDCLINFLQKCKQKRNAAAGV